MRRISEWIGKWIERKSPPRRHKWCQLLLSLRHRFIHPPKQSTLHMIFCVGRAIREISPSSDCREGNRKNTMGQPNKEWNVRFGCFEILSRSDFAIITTTIFFVTDHARPFSELRSIPISLLLLPSVFHRMRQKKKNAFRDHRLAYYARCAVGSLQWKSTITWSVPKHIRSVANVFVNNFRVRLFIRAFSDVFFGTVHVTFVCPMRHILCIFVIRKEIFLGFSCCAAFVSDLWHGERNLWLCKRDDYSTFNRPFQLYTVSVLLWIGRHWSFNLGVVVTSLTFQHKIYDTRTQRDGLRFTKEKEKRKNEARKF